VHEWSLAYSIVSALLDLLREGKVKKIRKVVIEVGKLVQIDLDIFRQALQEVAGLHNLQDVEFEIQEVETRFRCSRCGYVWTWRDVLNKLAEEIQDPELRKTCLESIHLVPAAVFAYARCPACGSPDYEVIEGFDVKIGKIVGEV